VSRGCGWTLIGWCLGHRRTTAIFLMLSDAVANWVELVSFGSIGIMLLSDLVSCQT
jgi:hypothetical protein